ncbi:MAG TPA: NAD(P)/FAD-dependent oxidoreductase, partial [Thermoplasmatales archaeon]|nr:NAD(P)/FAD-dependent oxidoreductase [Thermoplasmatales archaeon]
AETAKKNGAVYLMNTTLDNVERENGLLKTKVKHNNKNTFIYSKILIGADGAKSKVRKIFNLPEPQEIILGLGAEVENIDVEPSFVHIFLGKKLAPGFFAWIIPTEKEKARIGLGCTQPPPKPAKTLFNNLFNYPTTKKYLQHTVVTNIIAGNIPLGIINETVKNNVMIVGDAAAQVKPLSGGGLYTGLLSSKHCSQVTAKTLEKKKPTMDGLKKYHELWTKDIKREISFGMKIRKRFIHMNDSEIEHYFTYLEDETITSIISQYGDIDYPSRLLFPLIKNSPKLLHLLPKMMHLLL